MALSSLKTHKFLPWRQDITVLKRIGDVAELTAMRTRQDIIAKTLGISLRQVSLDLQHARELHAERATKGVDEHVADSLAAFDRISREAWKRILVTPMGEDNRGVAALLARVEGAEVNRAKILGLLNESLSLRYAQMSNDQLVQLAADLGLIPQDDAPTPGELAVGTGTTGHTPAALPAAPDAPDTEPD